MKFDAKGVPKWRQNRYQNSSKINAKTGNEKDLKFIGKTKVLDGLEGCMCER